MISQNLASSSIPGFKKQDMSFSAVEAGVMTTSPTPQHWAMPRVSAATNFKAGEYKFTDSKTDVAIDGSGFFQVQLPDGSNAYTRDGEFQISSQGQLVTKEGYLVVGDGGPIQLDRNSSGTLGIAQTGEVSQGAERRGKLKVVDFAQPEQLSAIGGGLFVPGPSGPQPEDVVQPSLRQGYVESSNTSTVTEMVNLISCMRSYEANQKVIQMHDDRMGKSISELGTPS